MFCPRCNGTVFKDPDGDFCLQCGWVNYGPIPAEIQRSNGGWYRRYEPGIKRRVLALAAATTKREAAEEFNIPVSLIYHWEQKGKEESGAE